MDGNPLVSETNVLACQVSCMGGDAMRRLSVLGLVLAFVAVAGVALAADDPTGTWKWTMTGGGGKGGKGGGGQGREVTLKLKLDGDKLTGAMVGRNDTETPIADASYKDGKISFSVTREFGGNTMTTKYSGTLSGDTITGKVEMPARGGGEPRTMDWTAKRSAEKTT